MGVIKAISKCHKKKMKKIYKYNQRINLKKSNIQHHLTCSNIHIFTARHAH